MRPRPRRTILPAAAVLFLACLAVPAGAQGSAPADAPAQLLGEWELTTYSPVGENQNTVEFRKDGEELKAFAKSDRGERPYEAVDFKDNTLTLVITIDYEGQPMTITYVGTLMDNAINGSADFGGLAMGTFSAARKQPAAAAK